MKRGDIFTVAAKGHYTGKPRPALVVQADLFSELPTVSICMFSSKNQAAPLLRLAVEPTLENGLKKISQIMIDKITTIPKENIGDFVGTLDATTMIRIDRSLAVFLGIAKAPGRKAKTSKKIKG